MIYNVILPWTKAYMLVNKKSTTDLSKKKKKKEKSTTDLVPRCSGQHFF